MGREEQSGPAAPGSTRQTEHTLPKASSSGSESSQLRWVGARVRGRRGSPGRSPILLLTPARPILALQSRWTIK